MTAARRPSREPDPGPGLPADQRRQWEETYRRTNYRELPWFSPRPYPWIQQGVKEGWLRRGSRVIDIGCGAGTNALFLARSGLRTSGIDLAPAAIQAAQRRATRLHLSVDFRVGDALRLPYPNGFFAGATDVGCFHTLPPKLRPAYSRELARVLRPGGKYLPSWVARESSGNLGPPHRPSLQETAEAFEKEFLFVRTEYDAGRGSPLSAYHGLLERRASPQPPSR